jgi:hypothetical protein
MNRDIMPDKITLKNGLIIELSGEKIIHIFTNPLSATNAFNALIKHFQSLNQIERKE